MNQLILSGNGYLVTDIQTWLFEHENAVVLEDTIMQKQFNVVIEQDSEGYYIASVPVLRGCHTQAKSFDELMERIKEAIELCLEIQDEHNEQLDFVGVQRVTVNYGEAA
jgi:predicted RNase H-like HicB family nuclease